MDNISSETNISTVEKLRGSIAAQLMIAKNEDFSMVFSNCMIEIAESLTATGIFVWVIQKDASGNDISRPYFDYSPHKGLMTMETHHDTAYKFDPENNPHDKALVDNEILIKSSDAFTEGEKAAFDDNVRAITLVSICFEPEKMWGYMGILYSDYAFVPKETDLPLLKSLSMILASAATKYSEHKAMIAQIAAQQTQLSSGMAEKINAKEVNVPSESSNSLLGTHILVVDDVEINRDIIAYILEKEGARVSQAEDGVEAVALFEAAPSAYSLIITDMHMPNMNGNDAAMNIRAITPPNGEYVPIVSMSAEQEETVLSYDGSIYIDANLHKPIEPQRLLAVVRTLLGR